MSPSVSQLYIGHTVMVYISLLGVEYISTSDTTILSHHPDTLCHFANHAFCLFVVCTGGLWKAVGLVVLGV